MAFWKYRSKIEEESASKLGGSQMYDRSAWPNDAGYARSASIRGSRSCDRYVTIAIHSVLARIINHLEGIRTSQQQVQNGQGKSKGPVSWQLCC